MLPTSAVLTLVFINVVFRPRSFGLCLLMLTIIRRVFMNVSKCHLHLGRVMENNLPRFHNPSNNFETVSKENRAVNHFNYQLRTPTSGQRHLGDSFKNVVCQLFSVSHNSVRYWLWPKNCKTRAIDGPQKFLCQRSFESNFWFYRVLSAEHCFDFNIVFFRRNVYSCKNPFH